MRRGVERERRARTTLSGFCSCRVAVERDRRPGWPPRVRYALTPSGHRLGPVLQALRGWGAETSARDSGAEGGCATGPLR
ncbi:winged helix-turn-helix transcriptional regulator [Streptomyces sp. NPDC006235]|uniref:winged helix-turn-helix transcriptional regulator n=1 Tax=Streptomyces sp. NPDC006235 TaxID=3156736 RepID=UPI0033B142C9